MNNNDFGDGLYDALITIKSDNFVFAEGCTCFMILNDMGFISEKTYTEIGLLLEKVNGYDSKTNIEYEEVISFIYDKLIEDEYLSSKITGGIQSFDELLSWMNDNVIFEWLSESSEVSSSCEEELPFK